ncbi:MAG: recombinase RecT [Treponema sp.]|jgi:recombination protein RecT|nr:recombinase RecT [Treponema sp.]
MKTDGSDRSAGNGSGNGSGEKPKTLREQLLLRVKEFEEALPDKIGVDRMMRIAMTAMQKTPHLIDCIPSSFFGALMTAMQMGLEPNTPLGHCFLIPRYNEKKNIYICNFEMGYQGLLELAYRTGLYRYIQAEVVYQGDDFDFSYGTNRHLDHNPRWKSETPIFVYAIYELQNGGTNFAVWSWEAIVAHAKQFSESFNSKYSPWQSNQTSKEEMGKKTVLKALLKYGPKSVEVAHDIIRATSVDGNTVNIKRGEDTAGESAVHFEVEYPAIEAPDETNRVPRQRSPVAEKDAAKEKEGEPAPATKAAPKTTGSNGAVLFPQDEDEALEKQYRRSQGGPNFGD